tara:strand:- start:5160 stop:5366 length:207 start_codon:yes stop_codon:yes gene_type:complete
MAVPVAKGSWGVCTTDAQRLSVARTSDAGTVSGVYSITKNLRLAYSTVGASGGGKINDTCFVVAAQVQ